MRATVRQSDAVRYLTGDAPCDEYNGTCDVTSGFRCVWFDDVRDRHNGVGPVQCVCTLRDDACRPTVARDDIGPTSPPVSDVIADVIADDEEMDVGGHSQWLLTPRHTDRLISEYIGVTVNDEGMIV